MGRGASANQVSTAAKPAGANGAPAGRTALAAARRRRPGTNKGAPANKQPPGQPNMNSGMLKFYTDDAPGLKIGPTTVLVLSLAFIGFVILLHLWGKFRQG